jgi:DNA polymerase-3 subunit epsilon
MSAPGPNVENVIPARVPAPAFPAGLQAVQGTLDELGTPLADVTFVVLDLETTGGPAAGAGITEIGAVKVRGGELLGEFQTLVDPGSAVPPFISLLTGITDAMLVGAPPLDAVLPVFLEFTRGTVLVAHNAPYDISFLRAACRRTGRGWPAAVVLDTAHLARHVVGRDEVRNHRLATLARLFGSPTTPNHRALIDARATVDVLHGLIARVGHLGVTTLEELRSYTARVPEQTRRKRHLADGLPSAPGVYIFRDESGRVLYVGVSNDIRSRVRSYFTSAEQRRRIPEMLRLAATVTPVPCATRLEARVRELRLIAEHAPAYNRRSRHPQRAPWVKLTVEPFPRLAVVREVRDDGATYLGPFGSTETAGLAVAALHQAFPLRQCSGRLPSRPRAEAAACLLADLGRCGAPCVGGQDVPGYAVAAAAARAAIQHDPRDVVAAPLARAADLATRRLFEDAATQRDRLLAFLHAAARTQRLAPLAAIPELLAARRPERGGWELVLVRRGRLVATTASPPRADPRPYIAALHDVAEVIPAGPLPAAHPEETELVLGWLEQPGVRLVEMDGEWSCPVSGAGAGARLLTPPDYPNPGALPRAWSYRDRAEHSITEA